MRSYATSMRDPRGEIAASDTLPPEGRPGYGVLIARRNAVISKDVRTQPAAVPVRVIPDTTSTGLLVLTVLLALTGIGLFGAGLGLFMG